MSVLRVDKIEGLTNNLNKIDLTTGGAATAAITSIAVAGSDSIVANSENTKITLAAGSNVNLSVDATNNIVTITATGNLAATNFVGMIAPFAMITPPNGWLICNGNTVSRVTYATLFAAIGTEWGIGDGNLTFHLPDLRGSFLRGIGVAGVDTDYVGPTNIGDYQDDQNADHTHTGTTSSDGSHQHSGPTGAYGFTAQNQAFFVVKDSPHNGGSYLTGAAGAHTHTMTINNDGATESRVYNRGVQFMIKY